MIELTIQEAKQRLQETIRLYLQKDAAGGYVLPGPRQRPVYLEGPPGVGKTEIVRQAAQEAGIGFVSYSMTHHSRQSAIGLPAIVEKEFGGTAYKATEYTMSEIVEAVWDAKRKGFPEGILFADEVNCVSETLTAAMLQFLQNKTFGPHRLPAGWIIVAAGNPPEYNRSVRSFDAVTLDRLRVLRVRPDPTAWTAYAARQGLHPVVLQYVREHREALYHCAQEKGRQELVTPRSWEDLSRLLRLYEQQDMPVTEELAAEYLQCEKIAAGFFSYYRTVRSLLTLEERAAILDGRQDRALTARLGALGLQERWAVLLALLTTLEWEIDRVLEQVAAHDARYQVLLAENAGEDARREFDRQTDALDDALSQARDRVDTLLGFIADAFGTGREAELAIRLMLENEGFQRLSSYRRLEGLIRLYETMARQRGETLRELQAWSRQNT